MISFIVFLITDYFSVKPPNPVSENRNQNLTFSENPEMFQMFGSQDGRISPFDIIQIEAMVRRCVKSVQWKMSCMAKKWLNRGSRGVFFFHFLGRNRLLAKTHCFYLHLHIEMLDLFKIIGKVKKN